MRNLGCMLAAQVGRPPTSASAVRVASSSSCPPQLRWEPCCRCAPPLATLEDAPARPALERPEVASAGLLLLVLLLSIVPQTMPPTPPVNTKLGAVALSPPPSICCCCVTAAAAYQGACALSWLPDM